jgi:NAD(P)-dependent dehydrogenase (short-subunit alcohol dehydrogenase family)
LVTGGASGIGQAIALTFIREGCRRIVLLDLNETGLEETKRQGLKISSDAQIVLVKCDISDEESVDNGMTMTIEAFGRLDYAVNCAGFPGGFSTTAEYSLKDFDRVQQVNVRGTWLCIELNFDK